MGWHLIPGAGPTPQGRHYEHVQTTAASTWTIQHNRGTNGPVTILLDDEPTRPVYTDPEYPNENVTILSFPTPVTGRAYV